jgi:hypothetical protein
MGMESGGNVLTHPTVTNTKDSIAWIRKTEWVLLHGRAETCIKAVTKMTRDMVMVKCIGLTVAVTRVNGKMVSNTVLAKWSFRTDE